MSTLVEFEPFVDSTTQLFLSRIEELYTSSHSGEPALTCNLGKWLQYYAFDVIGELTFSKRFGFLDQGGDVDNIIAAFRRAEYVVALGQMPWIDRYVRRPIARWSLNPPTSAVVAFTKERVMEKLGPRAEKVEEPSDRKDMLSRFLDAKRAYPDLIDDLRVLSYATSNVNAGADTTAITLTAIVYYLLKNPLTLKRLEEEILAAADNGDISSPCISWTSAQKLPYLDAVIKEALRMHPAVGLILERVVPPAGMTVHGIHIPGGTVVGVNPWVIHRDKLIFGADADQWRPERWLDSDEATLKEMNRSSFAFGAGTRTCIGKNISLLEMYKVVPAIVQKFELSLAHPKNEWKTVNRFLVFQTGLEVKFKLRNRPQPSDEIS
jgi:cytochrome P450